MLKLIVHMNRFAELTLQQKPQLCYSPLTKQRQKFQRHVPTHDSVWETSVQRVSSRRWAAKLQPISGGAGGSKSKDSDTKLVRQIKVGGTPYEAELNAVEADVGQGFELDFFPTDWKNIWDRKCIWTNIC